MKVQNYFNKQNLLNMQSFIRCDLFSMTGFERWWPMLTVTVHIWKPTEIETSYVDKVTEYTCDTIKGTKDVYSMWFVGAMHVNKLLKKP
jgi:hypothetical protein